VVPDKIIEKDESSSIIPRVTEVIFFVNDKLANEIWRIRPDIHVTLSTGYRDRA